MLDSLIEKLKKSNDGNWYELTQTIDGIFLDLYYNGKVSNKDWFIVLKNINNWFGFCMRSGVWTWYECADIKESNLVVDYLKKSNELEWADIYASGIHNYQDLLEDGEYNNPIVNTWIEQSEIIDSWINLNEVYILQFLKRWILSNI